MLLRLRGRPKITNLWTEPQCSTAVDTWPTFSGPAGEPVSYPRLRIRTAAAPHPSVVCRKVEDCSAGSETFLESPFRQSHLPLQPLQHQGFWSAVPTSGQLGHMITASPPGPSLPPKPHPTPPFTSLPLTHTHSHTSPCPSPSCDEWFHGSLPT